MYSTATGVNRGSLETSTHSFNSCKVHRSCIIENCALVSFDFKDEYIEGDFNQTSFEGSMTGGCSPIHSKNCKAKAEKLSNLLIKQTKCTKQTK